VISSSPAGPLGASARQRLAADITRLDLAAQPLIGRIPADLLPADGRSPA
jgi:hypothetical protein